MSKHIIFLFIYIIFIVSCSKDKSKVDQVLLEQDVEAEMILAYKKGMKELEKGDALYASKKFDEAEILFPQSIWASKASLMSAYALYSQNYYDDTIFNLERHIKNYPKDKDLVYAHYLIAICYFEQLHDEKKDLKPLVKAREKFEYILKKYPNTDYAIDAKWKMGLIVDQMAAKEMYIGRYYMKMEKWIAAINRFKFVVKYYDTTVYIEEALHRLVEIYYKIGLVEDAQKIAATLGYNYGSGEWYKNSYRIFNKLYKTEKITKKKKDSFIRKKFKKLFE
ncbi:MAG: outer membrane protein assembly factor BamD [Candidatus Pelagibacter sp.]|jgi:outer membrane protein assembly factor BamD|nr:outer membrane protein assembly factor BamD [Candidatus Pelagibacter sp.]MDP6440614.1 outer membrane protein assembly factor BamD [Pelagibacteraceae bacterium]|tara:strand:- start:11878 stop:12714 length:837 start_codon:yes stop_codon:yes gene_type:complete